MPIAPWHSIFCISMIYKRWAGEDVTDGQLILTQHCYIVKFKKWVWNPSPQFTGMLQINYCIFY